MTIRTGILACAGIATLLVGNLSAQAPAAGAAKAPAAAKAKAPAAGQVANLGQLMKGIFYINTNVIFYAQSNDPTKIKAEGDTSTSPNALTSAYGKWEAIENSALVLVEAPTMFATPRRCANGLQAPVRNPEWIKYLNGVREAGMVALAAARAKDMDKILDAADAITTACANCHDKWRDVPNLADRCK